MTENTTIEQLMFTIPETAQILGRGESAIRSMIKGGKIKAVKIGGKWSISKAEIERIMENGVE